MIWAAFILGLGGSLHCASMCGPLMFSVEKTYGISGIEIGNIMYHFARVLAYLVLAFAMSFILVPANLFGFQQHISLISGVLLLILVFKDYIPFVRKPLQILSSALSKGMQGAMKYKSSLFLLGFLNGLLPCGLSYSAAAVSLSFGNISQAIIFMALFGAGTIPMFLMASVAGRLMKGRFKFPFNKFMRYALAFTALLLVIRGSGLDIPYLSPTVNQQTSEVDCCHNPD